MERWCGKVAVVTGASSGIGAAIAQKLVEAGVTVVGIARRAEFIKEHAKRLSAAKGKLFAIKVDVTNEQEICDAFNWTISNVGPVQMLINNAGLLVKTTLMEASYAEHKSTIDTNLLAMAVCTREAIKQIKDNNLPGHIVNINSVCGNRIMPSFNMYSATKHASAAYAELLRHEIADAKLNIKVTSIMPGAVVTTMLTEFLPKFQEENPMLLSEEVADAVLYTIGTPQNVQITQLTVQSLGEKF